MYHWEFASRDFERVLNILGTTKTHLWLFTNNGATSHVPCLGTAAVTYSLQDEGAGGVNANAEAGPLQLPWGGYAYHFDTVGNMHIAASADSAEHSFEGGEAFSLGMWINPEVKNDNTLMAKYDGTAANEEYKWGLAGTTGALYLELHDASASASETGTADGAQSNFASDGSPDLFQWSFVVVTYDGTDATPKIVHYINARDVSNANQDSVESGAFVSLEDKDIPLLIGASEDSAAPAEEFAGYMALPFMTAKELSATEVRDLYTITQPMVLGR